MFKQSSDHPPVLAANPDTQNLSVLFELMQRSVRLADLLKTRGNLIVRSGPQQILIRIMYGHQLSRVVSQKLISLMIGLQNSLPAH